MKSENIEAIGPEPDDRKFIHDTIMNELLKWIFKKESKDRLLQIIENYTSKECRDCSGLYGDSIDYQRR